MTSLPRCLLSALALVVAATACSGAATHETTVPAASSSTAPTRLRPRAHERAEISAAALAAHDGAGVPTGWVPVDEGDARVWVPDGWLLQSPDECFPDTGAGGLVGVGSFPDVSCNEYSFGVLAQVVALVPSPLTHRGRPSFTVHGYQVYPVSAFTPVWDVFDVPALGMQIATHGSLGRRVLATLAPSARKVALDRAYESVPAGWHGFAVGGMSLSIPRSWTVVKPWFDCGTPGSSYLSVIEPDSGMGPGNSCGGSAKRGSATAVHEGALLYVPPHNPFAPARPTGPPFATSRHAATTIAVYAGVGDPNVLDLFVRRDGSPIVHVLVLGLGRDGRNAAGVLASIRAVT